jgi:hypothetical protein
MRTDKFLVGIATLIIALLSTHSIRAQQADTVAFANTSPFERYWTQPRTVLKFGAGAQDRAFFEIGLQYHSIYRHPLSLASRGGYVSVDVFVDDENLLLGPKVGYELTAGILGIAADVTYFIDQNYNETGDDRNAWVVTPKAGLSILGFVNLFYGYQIPLSTERISTISRNRFSLVINLNRDYFNISDAPRKTRKF